ncbi:MAG: ribbon-helix-helix protein, CopG family [Acidobacteria bacterium]|nr:ribbon-helix-helix protein, CopG family [Acidobacteriota bacterium]
MGQFGVKTETLYCRLSSELKNRVEREARLRGESASVVVREALREYFDAKESTQAHEQPTPFRAGLNSPAPAATPAEAAAAQVAQAAAASPAPTRATGAPSALASRPSGRDQLRRGARPKPQVPAPK